MIVDRFEEAYAKLFSRAARSPELGYLITTVVVYGNCEVMKPALPQEALMGEVPPPEAYKESRKVYRAGKWHDAVILEMEKLLPGNVVTGPAVIESGATTFVIPPAVQARLDQHRIFHLRHLDA